jgi:energy-coupling factor transport system substrate-specific component
MAAVEPSKPETPGSRWDPFKEALREHREAVGSPSYAVIAERIASARQASGLDPHAARVARTTVYDALQLGKARVNLELLREIGRALGATEEEMQAWIERCRKPVPRPADAPSEEQAEVVAPPSWRAALLLMLAGLAMNVLGAELVKLLPIDLFLDTIGTAVVALTLGPWRGAVVGYAYSTFSVLAMGYWKVSFAFGLVEIACALVWGFGARGRLGRSVVRYGVLGLVVSVVATAVATPILVLINGHADHKTDALFRAIEHDGHSELFSIFAGNLWASVCDKVLVSLVALVLVSALPAAFRQRFPLADAIGRVTHPAPRDATGAEPELAD